QAGLRLVVGEPTVIEAPPPAAPRLHGIELGETVRLRGTAPERFELSLVRQRRRLPVELSWQGDEFEATVALRHDPWGLGEVALPTGVWHFAWSTGAAGGDLPIPPDLTAYTPRHALTAHHRVTLRRGLRDQVLL